MADKKFSIYGEAGTKTVNPVKDVIAPTAYWSGAYNNNKYLPSPMEVRARPWNLPPDLKWLMLRDSQVFASYMLWKTAVLVDGIQIYASSNIKDSNGVKSKSRQKFATAFADCLLWNLNDLKGGLHSKLLQLLDCSIWGQKAASQVYREQTIGRFKGKLVLDRLRVMSNDDYRIRTNLFGETVGLQSVTATSDDDIFPIRKFLHPVFRPYDDHPLGTDLLWPIYEAFYEKKQIAPERLANAAQFGSPSFYMEGPENVNTVQLLDKYGVPMVQPNQLPNGDPNPQAGRPVEIPINHHLLQGLKNFEGNGSAMVGPWGAKLNMLQAQGNGEVFRFYTDDKNMEITKGIFFTTSWTEQEKYSSRGKGQVASSISNCSLMDGKKMMADLLEEYVAKNIIAFNRWDGVAGEELLDLVPEITFGNLDAGVLTSIMNSISALWSTGFFDDSQRAEICRKMAFPMPDPDAPPRLLQQPVGTVGANNQKDSGDDAQQSD